jgi:hypothetical protein
MKRNKLFSVLVIVSLSLGGCSKSGDAGNATGTANAVDLLKQTGGSQQATAALKKELAKPSALPIADKSTSDDAYIKLDSGAQLAFLYYAVSGMPIDYERMAKVASNDYRYSSDEFKKKELLDIIKPKIDERVAYFKEHRYVRLNTNYEFQHIDMASKKFPIKGVPSDGEKIYFNDDSSFKLGVTNGDQFNKYTPTDDNQAREIESLVSKYEGRGNAEIYLFAQDVDMASNNVKFQVVKVRLKNSRGDNVLGQML